MNVTDEQVNLYAKQLRLPSNGSTPVSNWLEISRAYDLLFG